jgi:hydrogenase maturation protease
MAKLTVLGLGNILMSDEGVGVRLVEAVRDARSWPADVEFIDGGVGGLGLMTAIEEANRLVVFDAAEMHLAPGESRVVTPGQLAAPDASARLSLHDVSFTETLRLCESFSRLPAVVRILAIQPKTVAFGRELSPDLRAAMPRLIQEGVELVERTAADNAGA